MSLFIIITLILNGNLCIKKIKHKCIQLKIGIKQVEVVVSCVWEIVFHFLAWM